jgi:hypothetical protein
MSTLPETIRLIVEVTRDDIENGFRRSENACPIALAVRHSLNRWNKIDPSSINVDGRICFYLNDEAGKPVLYRQMTHNFFIEEWIEAYDKEEWVNTFWHDIKFERDNRDIYRGEVE